MSSALRRVVAPAAALLFAGLQACGDQGPIGGSTEPAEIAVSPASASLASLGEVANVRATVRAADGTALSREVQWGSSNSLVASVTPSGDLNEDAQITAVGDGSALVTATVAGITGGVQIVVAQAVVALAFQQAPRDAVIGQSSGEVQVAALDGGGSPVASSVGSVSLDIGVGAPGALIGAPRMAPMQGGIGKFSDVQVDQLGANYRLRASWDGREATSSPFDIVAALDAVRVSNSAGGEAGLLVDGLRGGATLNDFAVVSDQAVVEVGVVNPAPSGPNEVVTFASGRRPALDGVVWSTGVDTVTVALDVPIEFDVTIWIVRGPFDTQRVRALDAIATTRTIWSAENAGFVIDSVEVIDATSDPDAAGLVQLTLCNSQSALETEIGKTQGAINVYYIETVDGGTDRGRACPIGGDHIIMAERSGAELLSHEVGHLLSLTHTDAITQYFDRTNVMHSASSSRRYLTEGQTFRQHFDPISAVNNIFGLRLSEARSCPRDASSGSCPAIEGRIWQDGSFPPSFEPVRSSIETTSNAHESHFNALELPLAAAAHRWVEVSCEMDENEGLTELLQEAGSNAVQALATIVDTDPDPLHRRVALDGLALLGGDTSRAVLRAAEGIPELAVAARAARERLDRAGR